MNTLSWMIYLGDVADGVSTFLGFMIFLGFASIVITAISGGVLIGAPPYDNYDKEVKPKSIAMGKRWLGRLWWAVPIWVFICFIKAVVPSKETFYLVAASELGESAATNIMSDPEMKEIFVLTKKRVITYLKQEMEPPEDKRSRIEREREKDESRKQTN